MRSHAWLYSMRPSPPRGVSPVPGRLEKPPGGVKKQQPLGEQEGLGWGEALWEPASPTQGAAAPQGASSVFP